MNLRNPANPQRIKKKIRHLQPMMKRVAAFSSLKALKEPFRQRASLKSSTSKT